MQCMTWGWAGVGWGGGGSEGWLRAWVDGGMASLIDLFVELQHLVFTHACLAHQSFLVPPPTPKCQTPNINIDCLAGTPQGATCQTVTSTAVLQLTDEDPDAVADAFGTAMDRAIAVGRLDAAVQKYNPATEVGSTAPAPPPRMMTEEEEEEEEEGWWIATPRGTTTG